MTFHVTPPLALYPRSLRATLRAIRTEESGVAWFDAGCAADGRTGSSITPPTWHPAREIVTRDLAGDVTRTDYARRPRASPNGSAPRCSATASAPATASRRSAGTAIATSPPGTASPGSARCSTRSTRGCSSSRSPISPTTPATASCSPTPAAPIRSPSCCRRSRRSSASSSSAPPPICRRPPYPALAFDDWIGDASPDVAWGGFDERDACGLCYTSGTTGNPKGVLYSHRSNWLHAMMTLQADALALSARDTVLLVVPMYHANAWGVVYSAPMVGAKLVLPGPKMDGAVDLRPDRGRRRHLFRRGADRLAGAAPASARHRPALLDARARDDRRLGGARIAGPRLRANTASTSSRAGA